MIKREALGETMQQIWDAAADVLSNDEVERLMKHLERLTHVSKTEEQEHIQDIRERYLDGEDD